MTPTRHVVGIMTGTSLDGIDAAMVRIEGSGLGLTAVPIHHRSVALGQATDALKRLAADDPMPASAWARAGLDLAKACTAIALEVSDGTQPDLVAVHGQTVHHAPPSSIQWINPAPIVQGMNCPVVHDLRAADLAAGGQGAPITPLADWIMFRSAEPLTVINLGGFCNVTHLPSDTSDARAIEAIQARDVCPCNHLLDAAAQKLLRQPYDQDGEAALAGQCDESLAHKLIESLRNHVTLDRSLGSGDEGHAALAPLWQIERPDDALATLVAAIAQLILASVPNSQERILLAGGGARNAALVQAISSSAPTSVELTNEVGVDVQARESIAMAILGTLAMDGVPITLPQVTGTRETTRFDGSWCFPRETFPREYT
ncbi:MAG: anhydro-N-acetylmuramic acid kinase [Planctomycetota bacterium]|nr:anhydro-N-acetylmuramic acid kinase [Planctomycetota bacterium]